MNIYLASYFTGIVLRPDYDVCHDILLIKQLKKIYITQNGWATKHM